VPNVDEVCTINYNELLSTYLAYGCSVCLYNSLCLICSVVQMLPLQINAQKGDFTLLAKMRIVSRSACISYC
jgi:hypothetical protein